MAQDDTRSLKDRLAAFAAEAVEERHRIETQRQELTAKRDADISAIQDRHWQAMRAEVEQARERWRVQLRELDETLALTKRLDRALNPSASPTNPKRGKAPVTTHHWIPSEDKRRAVLEAIRDGAETMSDITARIPFSSATAKRTVEVSREDGLVRLSGERPTSDGRGRSARTYALTAAGNDYLAANEDQ